MKEIPLSKGLVALVDDDDHDALMEHKWFAYEVSPGYFYAGRRAKIEGKWTTVYMHRVILDAPKGTHVDHRNGNRLDNRRENIRICTVAENISHRSGPQTNNTSGYVGVHWYKRYQSWVAYIGHKGKRKTIGYFDTAEEAARARDEKAKELHKEFAYLNFD